MGKAVPHRRSITVVGKVVRGVFTSRMCSQFRESSHEKNVAHCAKKV